MAEIKKVIRIDWEYLLLNIEVGKSIELGSKYFKYLALIRVKASDLKNQEKGVWKVSTNSESLKTTITRIA